MKDEQENLDILRKITLKPNLSQRELAGELGFSLGKLNYVLRALLKKGLVKIKNFHKNPKKTNYLYLLTKKGIVFKTKLTIKFMERKLLEYDELKNEFEKENNDVDYNKI